MSVFTPVRRQFRPGRGRLRLGREIKRERERKKMNREQNRKKDKYVKKKIERE